MSVDPIEAAALITAIPATIAAVLSYKANTRAKVTVGLAKENKAKLHALGNGVMDEKIKNAVREVMAEKPKLITEAEVAEVLARFLEQPYRDRRVKDKGYHRGQGRRRDDV